MLYLVLIELYSTLAYSEALQLLVHFGFELFSEP